MKPTHITIHCSATRPHQNVRAADIKRMHIKKGWRTIGYHYVIPQDGTIEKGRPVTRQGAHVKGHNENNIGVCLIGGLDESGKPSNTYNDKQLDALFKLLLDLCAEHGIDHGLVCGHRDWFGDTNNDGVVDKRDWLKECPCFNVREWFRELLIDNSIT